MAPVFEAPISTAMRGSFGREAWIAGTTGLLPSLFVLGCLWRYRGGEGCLEAVKVFLVLALALSFPVTCFMAGDEGGLICSLNAGALNPLGGSPGILSTGLGVSGQLQLQTHFAVLALAFAWWSSGRPLRPGDLPSSRDALLCPNDWQ
ncbi:unnamed protein product [Cladocopium goreaui]|uniref:Uncharacterized protein n=1 Tax=Cladocopium goreaui TaxID=2562237 RepID=A0A9P1CUR3_9DINO|nr:unnamed protein product [Cladocopium goreaui]|mmetsp:Transcript_17555/g.38692  ORF Transcript_17555/g.38692 Transcript_17555/m.38692 type:complete len:148 (-) Transcript_17555:8-451(-)